MRSHSRLLLATLATASTLASGHAFATTTADGGAGEVSGDSGTGGDFSSAWFVNPLPNSLYEGAPVAIDVEIDVYQGIDDSITDVELLLDGASIGTQACLEGCIFPGVVLEQGVHDFTFVATPNGLSSSVTVYVDTELPSDTSGESSGGESGSESGGGESGGEGGQLDAGGADEADAGDLELGSRGCNAAGSDAAPWMLTLPVLVLGLGLRRRRA